MAQVALANLDNGDGGVWQEQTGRGVLYSSIAWPLAPLVLFVEGIGREARLAPTAAKRERKVSKRIMTRYPLILAAL